MSDRRHIVTALEATEANPLPNEIQWMPPGAHKIRAMKSGKPAQMTVKVGEDTATAISAAFADLLAAGKRPYLDFNHAGGEASARVTSVRWAGDDPLKGGIRVGVEWTKPGAEAVQGGSYFSFSPTFLVGKDGRVTGTTANMGGLVNEPAFSEMAPVTAAEADETTTENPLPKMEKLLKLLVENGILPSVEMEDDAATECATAAFAEMKKKVECAEKMAEAEKTVAELAAARERIATLEGVVKASAVKRAEELVEAAAVCGQLPSKDAAVRQFWVDSIVTAGAPAENALKALPLPAALKSPERAPAPSKAVLADKTAAQNAAVAEVRASRPGISFEDAWNAAAAKNPEAFR